MTLWSAFYPDLLPWVIGCPLPMADLALQRSAKEFFESTRIWRAWLAPVTVLDGVREYDFVLPAGSAIVRIERSTLDGLPFDVLSHNNQTSNYADTEQEDSGLISTDRVTFTLARAVAAGAAIAAEVSLMPALDATGIPDDLFAQHANDISYGAKARLMMIKEASFYQPDLGAMSGRLFDAAVAAKTVKAWRGLTGTTPRPRVSFI